jgi:hypothetical protein
MNGDRQGGEIREGEERGTIPAAVGQALIQILVYGRSPHFDQTSGAVLSPDVALEHLEQER